MRVYLDVCCLCRPFDDQSLDRNRLEAEAVTLILGRVHRGEFELIGSEVLDFELSLNPDPEKRELVGGLLELRRESIEADEAVRNRSVELLGLGIKPTDALHVACAERGRCEVFFTTDDRLLRTATRAGGSLRLMVRNPLAWMAEQALNEHDRHDPE